MRGALLALALLGCKKGDADSVSGPSVRFEAGRDFWSAPLPSNHRLSGGVVDLQGFPNPDDTPIVRSVLRLLEGESGWGTTSGIFIPTDTPIDAASLPDLYESVEGGASVYLMDVDRDSPELGRRIPVWVTAPHGVVHSPEHGIALVPLQGIPLRPNTLYAAVVTDAVRAESGDHLVAPKAIRSLSEKPDAVFGEGTVAYQRALEQIDDGVVGLAVFTTGDPTASMRALVEDIRSRPMVLTQVPTLVETHDDLCVYEGRLEVTSYQTGVSPFTTEGGGIRFEDGVPVPDHTEEGRFWITLPRTPRAGESWPIAVMIRTGGGGDRPMIDRGRRDSTGLPVEEAEGPGRYFARAGYIGFQYDGPLGGLRNTTGGDEQFLVFNVGNPEALRDNLRQSAAELVLIGGLLDEVQLDIDESGCDLHTTGPWDTERMALMGHSMGATIAPLVLPSAPEFDRVILSGAGGSWIENILHKQRPLEVRPLAESMLGYDSGTLQPDDPFLSLLQWAGESADPPVHGAGARSEERHLLVFQGIVDRYILPPIANAANLSLGLDLAGFPLDGAVDELDAYPTLADLQPLVETTVIDLPAQGNQEVTAVVVQHVEDGIEDGHEVMFQWDTAKLQYQCFLDTARSGPPVVSNVCD